MSYPRSIHAASAAACDLEHRQEPLAGDEVQGLGLGTGP